MDDDGIERLLKSYRLPEARPDLDDRVLRAGAAILARPRPWARAEEHWRSVLHQLGFGYLAWLVDFVTRTDAEYRVEFL